MNALSWQTTNLFALISGHSVVCCYSPCNGLHSSNWIQHIKVSFNVLCRLVCLENENSAKVEKLVNTNKKINWTWLLLLLVLVGATAAIKPEIESSMKQQWIDWNDHYLASVSVKMNKLVVPMAIDKKKTKKKLLFIELVR